jgi:hypothetical protein
VLGEAARLWHVGAVIDRRLLVLGFLVVAGARCSEGDPAPEGDVRCDNLSEEHCIFPFPSDFFVSADESGGRSVTFHGALPVDRDGEVFADEVFTSLDGWPTITPIQFRMAGASLEGTAPWNDIGKSIEDGSKTLILDAETGERRAHWVEFDHFSEDAGEHVIVLRLARALEYQRRYVVVVRGLVDAGGAPLSAPRGFAALRDATAAPVVGVDERRAHFDEAVFPVAEAAGVARGEIQLAWDFTTNSEENVTGTLVAMRDRLIETVGDQGPEYSIDDVQVFSDAAAEPDIAFKVIGTASVPSFLLPPNDKGIRLIRRDAEGMPVAEGVEEVVFELQFPRSVVEGGGEPAAVLQYGHGFLGGREEADNRWLRTMANERRFVIAAIDMQGMNTIAGFLWFGLFPQSLSPFPLLSEEPHQGVINHVAIMRMLHGAFFADADPRFTDGGAPWYDRDRFYYYGNSQGGTTGNITMSLHVDVERGVLGVPGGAFSFLLNRANQWVGISRGVIMPQFDSTLDFVAISGLIQLGWDRFEGFNFIRRAGDNPFTGSPPHQILFHVAKEDAQVNNQVSECLGRSVDALLVAPPVRPIYGLEETSEPVTVPYAYAEYDFGVADNPRPNAPAVEATDTHGELRRLAEGQEQMWHFLTTGEVAHFCDGPCDPG